MSFVENIKKGLEERDLSQSSINKYLQNLKILNDNKEIKNLSFLGDKSRIESIISKKKPNTQRSYYISIVGVLLTQKIRKDLYNYYHSKMMEMNEQQKQEAQKNEKTETQKNNWLEWEDVENKLNELEEEVKKYKKNITEKEYHTLLKFIVLSLYTLQPPRRNEYQNMDIVKSKAPNNQEKNYLVYDNKEFIFRKYKTAKSELKKTNNELKIDISPELMENINLYLKFHPILKGKKPTNTPVPFLVNYHGEPLSSVNSITYLLNSVFKKKISSSMLRHIYLSSKYSTQLEEMKKDSQEMSHSTATQKEYIKK